MYSTQLQGAYLSGAKLQAADFEGTEFTLTNITSNFTGVTFGKITELEIKELLKRLSVRIKNQKLLKKIENILLKAMSRSVNLSLATGQNIWIENNDEIVQKAFRESKGNLDFAKSESIYQNGLPLELFAIVQKICC